MSYWPSSSETRIEGLKSDLYLYMHNPIGRKHNLKTDAMSGRETGAEAGGVNARGLLESWWMRICLHHVPPAGPCVTLEAPLIFHLGIEIER